MRKLLRLSAITALACIPVIGCSDDDLVDLGPIGGSAGDSGSGGNAGSGRGGTGGNPTAGSGGVGGSSGSAGTAGTAGTAGNGGTGGTGNACTLTECGTDCVDPDTTAAHCGACDRACSDAHASAPVCGSGLCTATCDAGFADCNVDDGNGADDGCETDLSQPATCGTSCGDLDVCESGEFCDGGVCTPTCSNTVCGTACVPVATSSDHCNACDRACSSDNVDTRACVAGACDPVCNAGFGDCLADDGTGADDGCETDFSQEATCGTSCGDLDVCDQDETCEEGLCTPICSQSVCGDECIDLEITPTDCGECGRACDNTNTASLLCTDGACEPACAVGFADCNIDDGIGADDGCETNLNASATCGTSCDTRVACGVDQTCQNGECTDTCTLAVCGSECVDTQTSITACGACDRACDNSNTTGVACEDGACAPTCSVGFGDCNVNGGGGADAGAGDDGCETDFSLDESCGTSCGDVEVCGDGESCVSGECTPDCAFAQCGGECIDLDNTTTDCGECDRACDNTNASSLACSDGACDPTCTAGFADCNVDDGTGADDGCETNLNANATCGTTCGDVVACAPNRSCVSGVCTAVNIVANSSVEALPITPWAAAQGGVVAQASDQFNTGTKSVVTVGRDQTYEGVGVNLFGLVTQGTTYDVSGFMRVSAPSTNQGRLTARADCPGNPAPVPPAADTRTQYSTIRQTAVSSTAWTQMSGTFTVPTVGACAGFSGLTVFFENADATLQIYADDLVVTAQ